MDRWRAVVLVLLALLVIAATVDNYRVVMEGQERGRYRLVIDNPPLIANNSDHLLVDPHVSSGKADRDVALVVEVFNPRAEPLVLDAAVVTCDTVPMPTVMEPVEIPEGVSLAFGLFLPGDAVTAGTHACVLSFPGTSFDAQEHFFLDIS